jgi:hypothetical protein
VAAGLLSPTATLIQPAFDVDSNAAPPPPYQPERDRVSFNGQQIGFLTGEDNQWKLNSFEIPIDKLKFPARGSGGSAPTPAKNEVRIDIDTANSAEVWCTAIDWSAQSFKAMSPVLLIHGTTPTARSSIARASPVSSSGSISPTTIPSTFPRRRWRPTARSSIR